MSHDPLTGIPSRSALQAQFLPALAHAAATGTSLSILLIDLDYFKSINDAFGHGRDDRVLVELVARLAAMTRPLDQLLRYGGDEFLLLLPETPADDALALGRRLVEGIRATPFGAAPPLSLSLSIGLANLPADGQSLEALIERATQARSAIRGASRPASTAWPAPGRPAGRPIGRPACAGRRRTPARGQWRPAHAGQPGRL